VAWGGAGGGAPWGAKGAGGSSGGLASLPTIITSDFIYKQQVIMQAISDARGIGITRFIHIPAGPIPAGTNTAPTAGDGATEGGGRKSVSSAAADYFGPSIFQNCRTKPWMFGHYGSLQGPTAARTMEFGLGNGAGNHFIVLENDLSGTGGGAADATHNQIRWIGAAPISQSTTFVEDQAKHWRVLVGDTVNVYAYVDPAIVAGVVTGLVGQKAMDGNIVDEPMYPTHYSGGVSGLALTRDFLYGHV
jgi:hypothetical protein